MIENITDVISTLTKAVNGKVEITADQVELVQKGTKFIFPDGVEPDEVVKAAIDWAKSMEEIISFKEPIPAAVPTEAAIVLSNVLREKYPMLTMRGDMSFFGYQPPEVISITIADDESYDIFLGNIVLPGFSNNESLRIYIMNTGVVLECDVKRKREQEIKALIAEAQRTVPKSSIFRGKAIRFNDVSWYENGDFDLIRDTPKVFDLSSVNEEYLVLNPPEKSSLNARIFGRITMSEEYAKLGRKQGGTWLFSGPYGTGKSYSISVAMKQAIERGWTVIQFDKASQFNSAVKIALRMQETNAGILMVIEDVELAMPADKKDEIMVELSNLLDGTDKKFGKTVLIMTTNNVENIHPLFLRRTEIIHFDMPNTESRIRLMKQFASGWEGKGIDYSTVADAMVVDFGDDNPVIYPPVFIERICDSAIEQAIATQSKHITTEMLLNAVAAARTHVISIYRPEGKMQTTIDELIGEQVVNVLDDKGYLEEIPNKISRIHHRVVGS